MSVVMCDSREVALWLSDSAHLSRRARFLFSDRLDNQTVVLFTLLRSCQTTTMPTILLFLTLLGVLYSHGHAMSREEKCKFRWVEETKDQWRFSLLTTCHIIWLAVFFLLIERNQVVEMFDHAYQNYMVSCLTKKHLCFYRIVTAPFFLQKVAKV